MKKMKRLFAVMMAILVIAGSLPVYSFAAQTEGEQPAQETVSEYAENGVSAAFTVTLDANGGCFENEQDDILQEFFETAEVISKVVSAGEAVAVFPVNRQGDTELEFAGWSLEKDGELISREFEEYVPTEDCILYAVWKSEENAMNGDEFLNADGTTDPSEQDDQEAPGETFFDNALKDETDSDPDAQGMYWDEETGPDAGLEETAEDKMDPGVIQDQTEDGSTDPDEVSEETSEDEMDPEVIQDQAEDDSTDPDAVLEETVDNETDSDDALEAAADGLDSNDALETAADGLDSDDALETAADGLDADDALEAAADGQEAHDDGLSPDDAQIEDSEETRDQENQDTEEYGPVLTGQEDQTQAGNGRSLDADSTAAEKTGEPPVAKEEEEETVSEEAADASGAAIHVDVHSQNEIRNFIASHPAPRVDDTFAVQPSAQAPYVAGQLSDESLQYAFNILNQMRYIAGVPADVSEKAEYTELAQAASLVNAANDELTHYPVQPAGMDDDLYQLGAAGASSSNIAWGTPDRPHAASRQIVHSVYQWMSDSDEYNIDVLGHRRWIINPDMLYSGFGEAEGYSAVYAHDKSRGDSSYYGVAWPAQNMPVEYFNDDDAWSVSFGMELTASNISVTLTSHKDGSVWNFSQDNPADGFFNVENGGYGQKGCVIFRPNNISYSAGDRFDVSISGVGSSPVTYTVDFFSVCSYGHNYESEQLSAPTCTEQGETRLICQNCWDVKYEYESAHGHSYQMTGESNGLYTMTCEECGDEKTGSVPQSIQVYWKEGEPTGNFSSLVPTGLEAGSMVSYYSVVTQYTADSNIHFDDFVVEITPPDACEIIPRPNDPAVGSIVFNNAGSYNIRIYSKYNPNCGMNRGIRIVKPLESVTLTSRIQSPQRLGALIPLTVTTDGGKGTLRYSFILIKEDGSEEVLTSGQSNSSCTFTPLNAKTYRLYAKVTDTGDGNRTVSSNILEFEIEKGLVSVKGGKRITAAGPLTYGQKLSELSVVNKAFISSADGSDLTGTFAFNEPDLVLPAGTHNADWTFTPDSSNYEPLHGSLRVTVNKAVPVITQNPSAGTAVYHPSGRLGDISLSGGEVNVPGFWVWDNTSLSLQVPGGTYTCLFIPNDGNNYEFVETQVNVTVSKAEPYVKTVSPTAITYGEALSDSALSGTAQYSSNDTTAVSGTFQWADNTVKPSVSDSGKTWYDVIFTPDDTANYKTAAGRARLTVNKADHPAEMPPESISVPYSVETVSDQILRDVNISNWSFASNDQGKKLSVGTPKTLNAVYNGADAGNFNTETVQVIVTRSSCEHKGSSSIRNAKDPTCTEEGATGDRYCDICGDLLESSTAIPANGHSWDTGVVTKKPSVEEEGVRTYTCTVCSEQREESIVKLIDISGATVGAIPAKTYNGSSQKPAPTVTYDDETLKSGTDYSVSYKNNLYAGTATVTITGKGKFGGTQTVNFTIKKAEQSITIKASPTSIAVGKTATVSISGAKGTKYYKWMKEETDTGSATVDSSTGKVTATKVGIVTIKATSKATDNFNAASKKVRIKIVPAATSSISAVNLATGIRLTWKKVTGATGYLVYRDDTKIATIKSGGTVTYTDAKANTNGTKYTFKIVPTASTGNGTAKSLAAYRVTRPAISSAVNSAAGKVTVKWDKNAKGTGYQIHYCTDKTFETGNKSVSINSASTVSKVIGSLTKGKTYYLRIRTFKTVGSTKYFSAWSAVKSVKISK